jgi:hypothetical protein
MSHHYFGGKGIYRRSLLCREKVFTRQGDTSPLPAQTPRADVAPFVRFLPGGTCKGDDMPSPCTDRSSGASVRPHLSSFRAGSKVARKSRAASISRNDSSARGASSTSSCGSRSTSSWACRDLASSRVPARPPGARAVPNAASRRRRPRISAPASESASRASRWDTCRRIRVASSAGSDFSCFRRAPRRRSLQRTNTGTRCTMLFMNPP